MKTLLTFILLASPCLSQNIARVGGSIGDGIRQENPEHAIIENTAGRPVKINAGKIKPDQWRLIFTNQISQMFKIDETGKWWQIKEFHFVQGEWKMADKSFGRSKSYLKISQNISGTIYLGYQYKDYEPIGIDLKSSAYVDGQEMYLYYEDTSKTFSYTTVLGVKKTVRIMTLVDPPSYSEPTFEQFVEKMKSGEAFKILYTGTIICPTCEGTGSVKNKPGRMPNNLICPSCKSKCKFERELIHLASVK
jgi:hypothetical protein